MPKRIKVAKIYTTRMRGRPKAMDGLDCRRYECNGRERIGNVDEVTVGLEACCGGGQGSTGL